MMKRRKPLTQNALAKKVGVTQAAVSRWLRQSRLPYPRNLHKICAVLGVHRQWLETGQGKKWLPKLHTIKKYQAATGGDLRLPPLP
jgi:transcriptional regulator with XRE-family HTH domain